MEEKKIETRVCIECGQTLPLDQFRKYKSGSYSFVCRHCSAKKYRATLSNKNHDPYIDMGKFPDSVLFEELKKRGFTGSLDFHKTIAV